MASLLIDSVGILHIDKEHASTNIPLQQHFNQNKMQSSSCIISVADEELLILIKFKESVRISLYPINPNTLFGFNELVIVFPDVPHFRALP